MKRSKKYPNTETFIFDNQNGKVHDTWDVSKCSNRIGNYWKEA